MCGDITIKINISKVKPDNKKHVINSIKGFVKALAKMEGLEFYIKTEKGVLTYRREKDVYKESN